MSRSCLNLKLGAVARAWAVALHRGKMTRFETVALTHFEEFEYKRTHPIKRKANSQFDGYGNKMYSSDYEEEESCQRMRQLELGRDEDPNFYNETDYRLMKNKENPRYFTSFDKAPLNLVLMRDLRRCVIIEEDEDIDTEDMENPPESLKQNETHPEAEDGEQETCIIEDLRAFSPGIPVEKRNCIVVDNLPISYSFDVDFALLGNVIGIDILEGQQEKNTVYIWYANHLQAEWVAERMDKMKIFDQISKSYKQIRCWRVFDFVEDVEDGRSHF